MVPWARQDADRACGSEFCSGSCRSIADTLALRAAPLVWIACLARLPLAHGGGSTIWVFSTTLLQTHTDDRFRGRVFSADLGFCMLLIAVSGYLASVAIDHGISVRTVAFSPAWPCSCPRWRGCGP